MYDNEYINVNTGLPVVILDEIDSTNEEAKRMIKSGREVDFAIVARKQTAGKGRKGRSFYSPKDQGIYLTFVHFTSSLPKDGISVTAATSVIVYRAVKDVLKLDCKIKWVNDLYYRDKKVCGILCEWITGNDTCSNAVVIGIGINISTSEFPEELSEKAGSLIDEKEICDKLKDDLTVGIINGLKNFFSKNADFDYMTDYRDNSMVLNKRVILSDASGVFAEGMVTGFNDNGALLISDDNGVLQTIDSGEISLVLAQ